MSFDEALQLASKEESFMATVYAMNTLLIHKGIYTGTEFEELFIEWMKKDQKRKHQEAGANSRAGLVTA